jgi:hypothetical protein
MKLLFALLFAATLPAVTVVNVACGGSTDSGYSGGARWTGAAIAGQAIPFNSMRSSSPLGSPFSYSFTLAPGKYTVTLQFIEPRADQSAGQRLLNVAINGAAVITGLDLFAAAGALKPYTSASLPVTVAGVLKIDVSATAGNAILSGIRIDDVPAPAKAEGFTCEITLGDAGNMFTGVYPVWACDSDAVMFIESVKCRADVDGQVFDVQAKNSTGAWASLLVEPVTCGPVRSIAKVLPGASYSGVMLFAFRVVASTPTTPSQFIADVVVGPAPIVLPPVATVKECMGSGPGWNCAGLLWATVPLPTGTLQIMGAAVPDFQSAPGTTWTEKRQ